jgi:predicted dehydrogenase
MDKIRSGFIGAGFIGPIHMENIRRLGFPLVNAVAEIDQAAADKAAAKLGIPKAYGRWQDLVNDPEVDVVHISCSNKLHYPIAKACLELGKPVICDKPLTLDLKEAKDLVDLAKKNNVINAVTFNMAFYPMVREAKEIITKGELGKINLVYGRYMQDWLVKDTDYNWRVEAKYQGKSRVVADIGSHWMHMVQMVLGKKIVSVYGDTSIFIPVRKKPFVPYATAQEIELKPGEYEDITVDTEDHATVLFKFEDGIKGVLMASQVCPGRKQRIEWEIIGLEKSIAWNGEDPEKLWIGYRSKPNEIFMKDPNLMQENSRGFANSSAGLAEGYLDSWKNIMSRIYEYIRIDGNKKNIAPDFPTFKDGYNIMLIIEAILESAEQNRWVDIDWSKY